MVLFKRKPVKFDPTPSDVGDYDEVWVIEKTGEVYNEYDKYLRRLDFYAQKLFTCESTGHSGYTFFEAMESQVSSEPVWEGIKVTETQTEASREIDSIFPDTLRSRVLHFVQFRTTSRMDDLVNLVFDEFKEQYMVGDRVCIEVEGPINRRYGVITDITDNSQLHQHAFTRSPEEQYRAYTYVITMDDNNEPITKYKAADLQRDRKYFSKLILKQFLRSTVTRESWIGAPWMAREHLAKRYKIPTKIPDNKTRESVMAQKKLTNGSHPNGTRSPIQQTHPHQLANGGAPQTNGHRPQQQTQHGQGPSAFVQFATNPPHVQHLPHLIHPHAQQMHGGLPPQFAHQNGPHHLQQGVPLNIPNALPPSLAHLIHHPPGALPVNLPFQNGFMQYQQFAPRNPPQQQQQQQQQLSVPTKPFEPIKYPIEDLEISQPRLNTLRPSLKFFSDDVPDGVEGPAEEDKTGILMRSVGPLLCAWETLNVHDTIYSLDSFTFDDFADAMRYSSEEQECELFVEVHCSVLKQIVGENGKLQASLPNMAEAEESEEEDSSEESTPTPEPEPPKRTTRSSLRKSEVQQIVEKARTPTPEPPKEIHKAAAFVADFDWVEQLKIRNFQNGGWQAIMVALLYRLSFDPLQKETCDEILAVLVPGAQEPTIESIAENYRDMDVNLRVSALDQVLRLTVTTEAFRDQLNAASLEMTRLRKEKIEFQRKRKELADDLFKLDLERKIKLPDNTPASPSDAKENEDVSMLSVTESVAEAAEGDVNESEDASAAKSRTRTKNKRKAAAEEARKEKAKKAKIEAEKNRKQKEWEKLLKSVEDKKDELKECEANINELDDDLRETLVHRSKVLGKDRFLNKYYWFEHNGMPFGGVPNSSTAEYGYANGRIWVQGPDAEELQPCLEEPALSQDMQRFKFTIPQRKEKEEGSTHLATSKEWAYYDDPEDIDRLIGWLDERGHREKQLRKELQIFRDRIAEYMEKMKKHLTKAVKAEEDEEDEDSKPRVSTRGKANADKEEVKDRCLLWTNSIMLDEYGYTHATEYEPPRKGKARVVKTAKSKGRR